MEKSNKIQSNFAINNYFTEGANNICIRMTMEEKWMKRYVKPATELYK